MERCVLFGGTTEGRKLAEELAGTGITLDVYTATEYGASLLPAADNIRPHWGRLGAEELRQVLVEPGTALCIDATHPFACVITEQLKAITDELRVPYLRVKRGPSMASVTDTEISQAECLSPAGSSSAVLSSAGFPSANLSSADIPSAGFPSADLSSAGLPSTDPSPTGFSFPGGGFSAGIPSSRTPLFVSSMREAAGLLAPEEGNILVTTGTKDLKDLQYIGNYRERCYVRVLPAAASLSACEAVGLSGRHIVAMQGPFGEELNYSLMKELGIRWLITKDSGEEGGCPEKCRAAQRAGVGIVLIGRPEEPADALTFEEAKKVIARMLAGDGAFSEAGPVAKGPCGEALPDSPEAGPVAEGPCGEALPDSPEVGLVAMGPGREGLLSSEARAWIASSDYLVGSSRFVKMALEMRQRDAMSRTELVREDAAGMPPRDGIRPVRTEVCVLPGQMAEALREAEPFHRAAVLCSGDISRYSAATTLRGLIGGRYGVRAFSGVSSVAYFLGMLGIPEEKVLVRSLHGRKGNLLPFIRANRYVLVLTGTPTDVPDTAKALAESGISHIRITVGSELSRPEEQICSGDAEDFRNRAMPRTSLALFENPEPQRVAAGFGIPDGRFLRGNVPMTKRAVRCAALSRLELLPEDIVYDIGAGTGSVSIEAALHVPEGHVYAIERNREGCDLIRANCRRFACGNVTITEGTAPEALEELPPPDAVFIGGSGGKLREILEAVFARNPYARVVLTSVTAGTDAEVTRLREEDSSHSYERTELLVIGEMKAGRSYLRRAENPVSIVTILPAGSRREPDGRKEEEAPGTVGKP